MSAGSPDPEDVLQTLERTWPAARVRKAAGWVLRDGRGGGKRVSSATAARAGSIPDISRAESAMAAMGQEPLFMIRGGEERLDDLLRRRGYRFVDPVVIYAVRPESLAGREPAGPDVVFCDAPLPVLAEIWAGGGIGQARLDVMRRAAVEKSCLLARRNDRPAAAGFVALHGRTAMVHGLEVSAPFRRAGVASAMMAAMAGWSLRRDALHLSAAVTADNGVARSLYRSLGMEPCCSYHYRQKKTPEGFP